MEWWRVFLLAALVLLAGHCQGAPLVRQLRLGWEAAGEDGNRPYLERGAGLGAAAYAERPAHPPPEQQQPEAAQPLHWWQRLWPWRAEPCRTVHVLPVWPDGSTAAMVDLELPQSHIDRELRPVPGGSGAAAADGMEDGSLYNYNSSAMMPLIPLAWSWMSDSEQMRNRSNGFDIDIARQLSMYAAIAYCDPANLPAWNCSRCNGIAAGFTTQTVVYDWRWNLMAYVGYSAPLKATVVSFRGTDSHSLYNWVENMRTWRTDLHLDYPSAPPGALVHGGFFYSYNSSDLAVNITRAVRELAQQHPDVPVYVVGHSLGGAMATLCALDIRLYLGIQDVRLYTFGSPRVGNAVFADWFRQHIKVRWRFTHNRDMVPSVPIQLMGFRHVAQEVWLLDIEKGHTLVGLCDESGEDWRCHSSMCHMGLCSSINDHLLYLSEMYAPRPMGC